MVGGISFVRLQVCVAVLRALCDGEDPSLQLESIVPPDRAIRTLLTLVELGLDAAPLWLHAGVKAGADVLCVLLHCLVTAGSCHVQPAKADREGSIYGSCFSSLPASLSFYGQLRLGLESVAEEASTAAERTAEAEEMGVAARAASQHLVVAEGAAALLIQLLGFDKAQCPTLRCIEVLACSPDSSVAIAHEDHAAEAFNICLRSDKTDVQLAALRALEALGRHQASLQQLTGQEGLLLTLEDLVKSPQQDVSNMASHVIAASK